MGDSYLQVRCLSAALLMAVIAIPVRALPLRALVQEQASGAPPAEQQQGATSGIAGGLGEAPVYDAEKRPITAGGFVDSGPVVFQDITKEAGLAGWRHKMGSPEKKFIVETDGSGVCL